MGKNEQKGEAWAGAAGAENPGQGPQPNVVYQFVPGAGFVPLCPMGAPCGPGQFAGYGPNPGWGQPQGQPYNQPGGQPYGQPGMGGPGMPPPHGPYGPFGPYGPEAHAHHAHHSHNGYGPQGPDMGQMYGMMNDVMQGKGDPGKLLGLFQAPGGEFWKGALVGAAAVLLLNSGSVKETLAGVFGAMTGQAAPGGCAPEGEEG